MKTFTGKYSTLGAARNAYDELISDGFQRDQVFLDEDNNAVKIMAPGTIEPEVREILDRHKPVEVTEHTA